MVVSSLRIFSTSLVMASTLVAAAQPTRTDWLVDARPYAAKAIENAAAHELVLENGLVRRVLRIAPDAATVSFDNLMTGDSELRSVRPEATITVDGATYPVGGLSGQKVHNYLLPQWVDGLTATPGAFTYTTHRIGRTKERFAWKPRQEWLSAPVAWPPPGVSLEIDFKAPASAPESVAGLTVTVHYELFDGLPVLSKWISLRNAAATSPVLNSFRSEVLAWVEPASMVGGKIEDFASYPRSLHVESEYAFGGSMDSSSSNPGVRWVLDPLYETQVNYDRQTPCLLECGPLVGPGVAIKAGENFTSPRNYELLFDSTDRERRGMALRRMYRAVAPWSQENPLIFHCGSAKPEAVRAAVDQAAEVGFELVIMTFGSGFDIENESPEYLAQLKEMANYAHAKGVALGGYSLLASRSVDAANDVINPKTGKPGGFATFGNSPCLESQWGQEYFRKLQQAFEQTGLDVLEHDGNYPGDVCASKVHPGHAGLEDSQWKQWVKITKFYQWCRGKGIYLNVPDWYYLAGSNKCGMGYRETNWSLPRAQQELIERQNIFDGTWTKTPSMGWMFVPLMQYHGGGAEATIEPLHQHLAHYAQRLDNLLGAGVQACYRGPRLFDTPETRDMVKARVAWFKKHRAILESDIVHGRRPDGRDVDWLLHVNPALKTPAMLIVHNPLEQEAVRTLTVDFSLSGLHDHAMMTDAKGATTPLTLDGRGRASVPVTIPARSMGWYQFDQASRGQ